MHSPMLSDIERAHLLDALQKQLLEAAAPALDRTLGSVDDYLFDRSQAGEEDLGLIALRDMRRLRGQIAQRFAQALADGFGGLRRLAREMRQDRPAPADALSGLSLLSDQDLEQQLAVEQLATSVLRAHASAFELLNKRLAQLVGQDVQDADNPLGPQFQARALVDALDPPELGDALRVVVLKFFERELAGVLGGVFDRASALMASAGILRDLRTSGPSGPRPPASAGQAGFAPAVPPPPQGGIPQTDTVPMQPAAMQGGAAEQALFASMLGMLQGWRTTMGMAAPAAPQAPAGPPLGTGELLSILSLMQQDAGAPVAVPGSNGGASLAGQLRQQMAQSARKLGVAGDNLHLDGLDSDAVDLVALLFDVLLDGPQYDTNIRHKIGRMLVPYVKVAVKDRRMFLYKEHPARRLLNTVAEACEGNRGEAPQERELLTKVDHTIDRLVAEFNEDVAIFETLEQELRGYMAQHRKRFELAERRSAEAQQGRERLQHARDIAAADLARARAGRDLPPVIAGFLDRQVAHHLAQLTLREGRDSERYHVALRAIDQFLVAFDWASEGGVGNRPPLPAVELEQVFASSGCTGDAAHAAIDALQDALARIAGGDADAAHEVRLPEAAALPDPAPLPPEDPPLAFVAGDDALDYDADTLARMRTLKVGDWLHLVSAEGRAEPAKVSWISPISARLLLVNRRGIRVLVASVQELAAMAKLGKVQLREAGTAFDDAMHQMADRLKSAAPAS